SGIQNGHVTILVPSSTFNGCGINIFKPDGTVLATASSGCNKFSTFYDPPYLPQTGRYTVSIDPVGTETGSVTVKLNDAGDITGWITTDGSPTTVTTTVSGQNAKLTFSGTAGQRITASLDSVAYGSSGVGMSILTPSGSQLISAGPSSGSLFLDDTQYCFS